MILIGIIGLNENLQINENRLFTKKLQLRN